MLDILMDNWFLIATHVAAGAGGVTISGPVKRTFAAIGGFFSKFGK